mmetsp:Transcript_42967/g.115490  ORF Transcript_42967/g.115490 Transcript_42967/m.115490 type:complete len:712 (-) Transcript_42967:122-2257(-)
MIHYASGSGAPWNHFLNLFQMKGSGFPLAIAAATLPAALTFYLRWNDIYGDTDILVDNTAWGGFSFLVGFLVVFRTSQAYNRFWDGCTFMHRLQAEWLDACSATIAFTKHSSVEAIVVTEFKHLVVRLFSLLHMFALAYIEGCDDLEEIAAHDLELIDPDGLDQDTWNYVRQCRSSAGRVTMVFQWIQAAIVENISTGVLSIPAPILSRVFQELANGMVALHDAHKISAIPFPFPYAQTCDALLVTHSCVTPFVTCSKMSDPYWACLMAFIQVFILWSLNYIAVEIEHPFGGDPNDIDSTTLQLDMNLNLLLLLHPACDRTPVLSSKAKIQGLVKMGRAASHGLQEELRTYNEVLTRPRASKDLRGSRLSGASFFSFRPGDRSSTVTKNTVNSDDSDSPRASASMTPGGSWRRHTSTASGVVERRESTGRATTTSSYSSSPSSSRQTRKSSQPNGFHQSSTRPRPSVMQIVGHALAPREAKFARSRIAGAGFDAFWDLCEEAGDNEEVPRGSQRGSLAVPPLQMPPPRAMPQGGEDGGCEGEWRWGGGAGQQSSGSRPPRPPGGAGNSCSADHAPAAPPRGQQREAVGSAAQSQAGSSPAVSARSARGPEDRLPPPPRARRPGHGAPSFHRMPGDHDPEPQSPPQADLQALVPCGSSDGSGASAPAPTMPRLQLQSVAAHVESSPWSFHHQTETISRGSSVVSKDVTLPLP